MRCRALVVDHVDRVVDDPSVTPTLSQLPRFMFDDSINVIDVQAQTPHITFPFLLLDSAELPSSAEGGTSYITPDVISVV